jgi:NADPH2:quinone reductase
LSSAKSRIRWSYRGTWSWTQRLAEETARAWEALTELVADGMRPAVSEVHDLADTAAALRRVADRAATGKVVIRVAN